VQDLLDIVRDELAWHFPMEIARDEQIARFPKDIAHDLFE
jgi:hypothetical protein